MTERTFTLRTLHGNIDYADAQKRRSLAYDIDEGELRRREPDTLPPARREEPCDVIAVFVDATHNNDRIELHFGDWKEVAGLREGLEITFTIPDAPVS